LPQQANKIAQQIAVCKHTFKKLTDGVFLFPKGRDYTVSIALPGSILSNAQSLELRTYLAGQVTQAVWIFALQLTIIQLGIKFK
jgi:hypothetical protein